MMQVSNWFINARVRLWKPMVEDMYQQEVKEEGAEERERNQSNSNSNTSGHIAQTPTATTSTATAPPPPTTPTTPTAKRSDVNASERDPSLLAINRQPFSERENQATTIMATAIAAASEVTPPVSQPFDSDLSMPADDTCRHGSFVAPDYGTTASAAAATANIGSTLIRFGTTSGDVSLTLGLRHAGNIPDTTPFSVRDFGGI